MAAIDLRQEVQRALRVVWPAFERAYPRLAPLFDPILVLDAAVKGFGDDPDYEHAMADAVALRVPEQEMTNLIRRLTWDWLELIVISRG